MDISAREITDIKKLCTKVIVWTKTKYLLRVARGAEYPEDPGLNLFRNLRETVSLNIVFVW